VNNSQTSEQVHQRSPMPSFEKKIIASILNRIREDRRTPSTIAPSESDQRAEAIPAAKVREAKISDYHAVTELKRRWSLIPDGFENWEKLWVRNPALAQAEAERPMGWILEAGGSVVGYLGNISSTYFYGEKILTAATAHGLVVDPLYRSASLSLSASFFRQKSVDILLGTTAVEAVGKIARAFRSDPLPQPDYDTVLFWILRPFSFAQAVSKKLKLRPSASRGGSLLGSMVIAAEKVLLRRWPKSASPQLSVKVIKVNEIGEDFERLWDAKRAERPRLLSDRRPATLRWHFEIPGDRATKRLFCCFRNHELEGYLVLRHEPDPGDAPRRSLICDMLIKGDRTETIEALFVAAYDDAKRAGSHIIELMGFPASIRQTFLSRNPYQRKYPACPFYFKAIDPALHKELSNEVNWYASPYDGDATLMP